MCLCWGEIGERGWACYEGEKSENGAAGEKNECGCFPNVCMNCLNRWVYGSNKMDTGAMVQNETISSRKSGKRDKNMQTEFSNCPTYPIIIAKGRNAPPFHITTEIYTYSFQIDIFDFQSNFARFSLNARSIRQILPHHHHNIIFINYSIS